MKQNQFYGISLFLLRLGAGIVLFIYGYLKLFGNGFTPDQIMNCYNSTIRGLQSAYGIPPILGALNIAAELLGGIGLILGLFGRLAAFVSCFNMAVATYVSILAALQQFKLKQMSNIDAIRYGAFPALVCIIALVILLNGAGIISIDYIFRGKRRRY